MMRDTGFLCSIEEADTPQEAVNQSPWPLGSLWKVVELGAAQETCENGGNVWVIRATLEKVK